MTVHTIPADAWKKLTSTVGLIAVRHDDGVNVMAAEWTYFLNKQPLYVGVVLSPRARTRELLAGATEFSVTLCAQEQAALADFAGSFSLEEVDKTSSELLELGDPVATGTPWVRGGLVALECELRSVVELPVHRMFIGEVVALHEGAADLKPLVKHGAMHTIGERVRRTAVVAAAHHRDGQLEVFATGPDAADDIDLWHVHLVDGDGVEHDLGAHPSAEYGDFAVTVPVPPGARLAEAAVRVERSGAEPGHARLGERQAR
ncbi:flavin reductase family protein [Actinokineospora diospyrosa]|nr:flavin reductase family protein [Actinokineospora diospyrosa]